MSQDTVDDLKQFITVTAAQQAVGFRQGMSHLEQRLERKIGRKIAKEIDDLENRLEEQIGRKIDTLSAYVAQALDTINESTGLQLIVHEQRITQLEHHTGIIT